MVGDQASVLDYSVVGLSAYYVQGKMDSMMNQSSAGWKQKIADKQLAFQLKLLTPAKITLITIKSNGSDKVCTELIDQYGKLIEKSNFMFSKEISISSQISSQVTLYNNKQVSQPLGLKSLIIKGMKNKQSPSKKVLSCPKNERLLQHAREAPHHMPLLKKMNDSVFSERKRAKKTDLSQEDDQIKRVMAQSIREISQQKIGLRTIKEEPMDIEQCKPKTIDFEPRKYRTYNYEANKHIFQYVNSDWLEAQKAAEKERNIRECQRLSKRIKVRHFHDMKICVDSTFGNKRQKIQNTCKQMGAIIVPQPVDYCVLVAPKSDSQKIIKSSKYKGVKVVREEFVGDCQRSGAHLNENDYFFSY